AGLVVVVHEIDFVRTAIGGAVLPVVNDIVPDIEPANVKSLLVQTARETPVPSGAMREQVVMKAADVAAYARGVTVLRAGRIFFVAGFIEGFGDERALE